MLRRFWSCAFVAAILGTSACASEGGAALAPPGRQAADSRAALSGSVAASPRFVSDGVPWLPGKINAFAVDPASPQVLYIASGRGTGLESYSSAGISKTSDGGKTWTAIDRGLVDSTGAISSVVNALWLDPKQPSVLLAATEYDGLFRSTNAGASWSSVFHSQRATQIVEYEGALYAATANGVVTSTDDGATWRVQLASTASAQPSALGEAQGTGGSALYAGTTDGSIYAFANGTWNKAGTLPYDPNTGTAQSNAEVHQIAVDPLSPATLYASSNDGPWNQDLHASTDGGRSWHAVKTPEIYNDGLGTQAIAYSLVHPHQLYVGSDGLLFLIDGSGSPAPRVKLAANSGGDLRDLWIFPNGSDDACYIASDQGLIYEKACSKYVKKGSGSLLSLTLTALARRFAISPDRKTILSSFQDWDSFSTTKGGGANWQFTILYEDGYNEMRPGDPSVCYAYDEAYGLAISGNGCQSFKTPYAQDPPALPSRLMTSPIAFDPRNPLHMYLASGPLDVVAAGGLRPAPKAAFETTDGGHSLHRLPWPVAGPGAIVVDQRNGDHIVVGDLRANASSIQVSFDGGKTWSASRGVPATPFWYAITISPANDRIVLASNVDSSNNVFVLRSADGGRTFRRVANVVNAPLLRGRIDPDRLREARARAGVPSDGDAAGEAARAPQYFNYSPEREIRYNQDATAGTPAVALTTMRGAFLSTDDGSSWQRLDRDLVAHSFWGIRWVGGYLYLGSDGQGIVQSTQPVQAP